MATRPRYRETKGRYGSTICLICQPHIYHVCMFLLKEVFVLFQEKNKHGLPRECYARCPLPTACRKTKKHIGFFPTISQKKYPSTDLTLGAWLAYQFVSRSVPRGPRCSSIETLTFACKREQRCDWNMCMPTGIYRTKGTNIAHVLTKDWFSNIDIIGQT